MADFEPRRIVMPSPKLGGKCFLIKTPGLYVFEEGPGVLRTMAVTHAGSGSLVAFDGVPDDRGLFPDETMEEYLVQPDGSKMRNKQYDQRNGRAFYRATPAVMGSWMVDAGFYHGLTLLADGGGHGVAVFATIVWMPVRVATPKIEVNQ